MLLNNPRLMKTLPLLRILQLVVKKAKSSIVIKWFNR